jgi:chromosomal replication initiation ATPase DnaA
VVWSRRVGGERCFVWQETREVLTRFAEKTEGASQAYAAFVAEGVDHDHASGQRTESVGRDSVRAISEAVTRLDAGPGSTEVLGSSEFGANLRARRTPTPSRPAADCHVVVDAVCRVLGLSPQALASRRRTRPLSNGRAVIAYVARTRYQIPCANLADALGTSAPAITLAERRGARLIKERLDLRASLQKLLN